MREYSDFIILGEDYVDLLGSCTKILFRIFVNLCNKIENKHFSATSGIGHTRWATHGKASLLNCHPHISENFVIVHNGIIENYKEIKSKINCEFYSETDSEVIAKLIEKNYSILNEYSDENLRILNSIMLSQKEFKGSWAVLLICKKNPSKIYAFKNKSPLLVAQNNVEAYVASDINAFEKTENKLQYFNLNNENIVEISSEKINFYDKYLNKIKLKEIKNSCYFCEGENGFKHKMLKEICEIPQAILNTKKHIKNSDFKNLSKKIKNFSKITIIGCGTAFHAALYGKFIFEKYLNINVNVELASEYRYKKQIPQAKVINQACPLLATMAEKGEKEEKVEKTIQEYLQPFRNKRIDTLILGCTHYPIFKEIIARQLPEEVEIMDTSYIVAKKVKEILEQEQLETIKEKGKYEIELTKEIKEFKIMAEKLLKKEEQI